MRTPAGRGSEGCQAPFSEPRQWTSRSNTRSVTRSARRCGSAVTRFGCGRFPTPIKTWTCGWCGSLLNDRIDAGRQLATGRQSQEPRTTCWFREFREAVYLSPPKWRGGFNPIIAFALLGPERRAHCTRSPVKSGRPQHDAYAHDGKIVSWADGSWCSRPWSKRSPLITPCASSSGSP